MKLRKFQNDASDSVFAEFVKANSTLVVLPTGCHSPDSLIMDYFGNLVPAKELMVGMPLMGPDSKPRFIIKVHRGTGPMYKICPVKGEPFIVNEDHVLTLVRTREGHSADKNRDGEIVDVSVKEWMTWTKWKKHIHKLFRVGINFNQQQDDFAIDPYVMGALLGDGSFASTMSFTTKDHPLLDAVRKELSEKLRIDMKDSKIDSGKATCWIFQAARRYKREVSALRAILGPLNKTKSGTKFIPQIYKTASYENRLSMLAGLIDTDGSLTQGGYDIIFKSKILAEDTAFIARSCGLAAYVKPCVKASQKGTKGTYYRISLSGDCSVIPCRLPDKVAPTRKQKKSVLRTGFSVESLGEGEYVGFTVGPENHYVMGDFTVTHNCGKTVVFADVSRRMWAKTNRRVMVIAHREELIFQAKDKIMTFAGLEAQVEMGEYRVDKGLFGYPPVIVSTVQTHTAGGDGCGRMAKFDPMEFGLLIIDECHHSTADTYKRVIEWYMRNPNMKLLGVTATPDRTDEEALGQVFGSVAFDYEVMDAIKDGWLVPVSQQMVTVGHLDLSEVRTTAGDLNAGDLSAIMDDEQTLHEIASPTIEICGSRRTLIFAATVKQAERLCEILNRHREGCASFVCGKTDKEERKLLLAEFKAGRTQFVVNVGVLTEGFDDDGVEVVVMARPTKSRALYAQMAGRGTRPHSSIAHALGDMESAADRVAAIKASPKPGCLIIDFVGNCGRHKLCTTADILGGNYSEEEVEKASQKAKNSSVPVDMTEALDEARRESEEAKRREAAKRASIICKAQYSSTSVDPFDVFQIHKTPERGWDKHKTLSEAQLALLAKQGISTDGLSYSECKQLLDEVFRRFKNNECSYRQVKTLKRFGYSGPIKRDQAKVLIDRIAANGWRAVQ